MNTSKFVRTLKERKENTHREHQNIRDFDPKGQGKFKVGSAGVIDMSADATREFLGMIGVPKPFYDRCEFDDDLQTTIVKKFIGNSENFRVHPVVIEEKGVPTIVGFWDDNKPFAYLYDMFERVNDAVNKYTNGNHEVTLKAGKSEYSQDTFYDARGGIFSWTSESVIKSAKVGDITEGGVRLMASDWMRFDPAVSYYANRLICTNGMVSHRNVEFEIKGLKTEQVLDNIGKSAEEIMKTVGVHLLDPFVNTNNHKVENPIGMARSMIKDHGIKKRVGERFIENVDRMVNADNGPYTMYDIINCLTSVQNDDNIKWNDRELVQFLGGIEVVEHQDRCRQCHHILN